MIRQWLQPQYDPVYASIVWIWPQLVMLVFVAMYLAEVWGIPQLQIAYWFRLILIPAMILLLVAELLTRRYSRSAVEFRRKGANFCNPQSRILCCGSPIQLGEFIGLKPDAGDVPNVVHCVVHPWVQDLCRLLALLVVIGGGALKEWLSVEDRALIGGSLAIAPFIALLLRPSSIRLVGHSLEVVTYLPFWLGKAGTKRAELAGALIMCRLDMGQIFVRQPQDKDWFRVNMAGLLRPHAFAKEVVARSLAEE
jgi:hypothetical protein